MNNQQLAENDPRHHTAHIKQLLHDLTTHLREDVDKVNDPSAQALFETTAEVLEGLSNAYDHYEEKAEKAWQH